MRRSMPVGKFLDGAVRHAVILGALVLGTGCERVVSVEAPEGAKRLVVEARLERVQGNVGGAQRITLSTTDSYFSKAAVAAVRGATVQVADAGGAVVRFAESPTTAGVYETSALVVEIGRAYTLTIDYAGERFQSTETALPVARIDTLYFRNRTTGVAGPKDGLRATISLRDPAGTLNYYLWDQLVDGRRLVLADSGIPYRSIASDDLYDGRRVRDFQPYDGIVVKSGQLVQVRQVALSERVYRFYAALSEQAGNDGSPFGVPPANVRGNVANLTNPSRPAVGYFIAAEVAERSARVP